MPGPSMDLLKVAEGQEAQELSLRLDDPSNDEHVFPAAFAAQSNTTNVAIALTISEG